MAEHNVVFTTLDADCPWSLETYLAVDGYQAWKKIVSPGAACEAGALSIASCRLKL